jgi:hypothetical protein
MFLPPERLSTVNIGSAKTGYLMKAVDRAGAVLWILEAAECKFAVFLTGEYAKRGFEIKPHSGGKGCAVGPVKVRVDPSSVSDEGVDWSLKARGESLQIVFQAEKPGGFPEHLWAPVAPFEALDEPQLYFTRWTAGVDIKGEWVELVSVAKGQLTTGLNTER